jgi:hypothetical protein
MPKKIQRRVRCTFCNKLTQVREAHRHQGRYVGPCCWDERLRSTE